MLCSRKYLLGITDKQIIRYIKGEIVMNEEEIEELKDFTIDLTDIDELALGLEVCSKKSNMVIQEFADTIIQLQQENKKLNYAIQTYDILLKSNVEENQSLKKQLEEYKDNYNCLLKQKDAIDKAIEYNKKNIHSQTLYKILKEE